MDLAALLEGGTVGNSESSDTSALDVLIPLLVGGILAAVGIIGWHLYSYLRSGEWPPLSIITVLLWLDIDWVRSPSDWAGVHKILNVIPLSLAAFAVGVAPIWLWTWWDDAKRHSV